MRGVKLVDRKNNEGLMAVLGLKKTLDKKANARGERWYGHVVRRNILLISMLPIVWAKCRNLTSGSKIRNLSP